jgi:hypothetical protein
MKMLYEIELLEKNGEQEYSHSLLCQAESHTHALRIAQKYTKTFYSDEDFECTETADENLFIFMGGLITVRIESVKKTSKRAYIKKMLKLKTIS